MMRGQVTPASVPAGSQASLRLPGAYFHDCYQIVSPDANVSALELYLHVVEQTPAWVNRLMALRNWLAGLAGLKNLGHLGAARGQTGKRISYRRSRRHLLPALPVAG